MTRPDVHTRSAATAALGGAALVALSTLLPWTAVDGGERRIAASGLEGGYGRVVLAFAVVAAACALWVRRSAAAPDLARYLVPAFGLAIGGVAAVAAVASVGHRIAPGDPLPYLETVPAFGLVVTVVGAVFVTAGGWLAAAAPRSRGCPRCADSVTPEDLPQHLVRRHGVAPEAAMDEASRA